MMKKLSAALLCVLAASCVEKEPLSGGREELPGDVVVDVSVRASASRSSYLFEESAIRDICVFAYLDGALAQEAFAEDETLVMTLGYGKTYTFYALANAGEVHAPASEEDLAGFRLVLDGLSAGSVGAIPMATTSGCVRRIGLPGTEIPLVLERLMSRCTLTLDPRLEKCAFEVSSVTLRNAALDVTPFRTGSKALSVADGDSATQLQCSSLDSGGSVSFYMLENCRGVLLPSNLDPGMKVPSEIGEEASLCTYLEIAGRWSTAGAGGVLKYRIYLGEDNCSDFSIPRNTASSVRLVLTDQGSLGVSWKVTMEGLEDSRTLRFDTGELTVWQGGAESTCGVTVSSGAVNPGEVSFFVTGDEDEIAAAALTYGISGGVLRVRTSYIGTDAPEAHLVLSSWDGRKTDTLLVRVAYVPGSFRDYSLSRIAWSGQWGCFNFPGATSDRPVTLSTSSGSVTVSPAPGSGCDSFYDSPSGMRFHYPRGGTRVYYCAVSPGGECNVHLSQFTSDGDVVLAPAVTPRYLVEDVVLDEAGTAFDCRLRLSDAEGESIPLSGFAVPDAVLSARGQSLTAASRYSDFADMYAGSITWHWKAADDDGFEEIEDFPSQWEFEILDDVNRDPLITEDDEVARLRFWGLEADGIWPADGTLKIRNEYFPVAVDTDVPLTVNPAFPGQRYLGEFINYRIAPGALRSGSAVVDFRTGGWRLSPSAVAAWTVSDALFSPSQRPSAAMATSGSRHAGMSFNGTVLSFAEPSETLFPSCGAFLLEGSLTNARSGRTVRGWYTFDVSLYLTVGVQVDFDGYELLYSFVPFCEYATRAHSDIWNDNFLPVRVRSASSPSPSEGRVDSYVCVPEKTSDNFCSYHVPALLVQGSVDQCCSQLDAMGLHRLFSSFTFLVDSRSADSLVLNREGCAQTTEFGSEDICNGSCGYYRISRQYAVRNIAETGSHCGLDNLLVEPCFGSFVQY